MMTDIELDYYRKWLSHTKIKMDVVRSSDGYVAMMPFVKLSSDGGKSWSSAGLKGEQQKTEREAIISMFRSIKSHQVGTPSGNYNTPYYMGGSV